MSPRARLLRPLLALLACAGPLRAGENLAVIVNPDCGVSQLSREEVVEIYMGRQKRLPTGLLALPVEQVSPLETRARFYQTLVNLPLPQVRAYWARLYFSGQAQPPRQTGSDEETLEVVAANKGAIGFIDASKVDRRVRAVLELETKVIPAFLRRSLVLRTTLVVLAVALLVGGLAQTAANRLVRRWEAERRRLTLEALLDVVAPSAAVAGFAQDQALAQQVVDGLIGTPMVHGAAIRTSGQLLVQAERESPLPGPAETYVRVLMSPFDPKTRIGELVLTPDPREAARREAAEVALTRLTLAGLGLAMGLAVAAALHGLVLAPITGLIHRLHGLQVDSGGRLATPRGHEEDEIGRLVADVNGLVQRLTDALWKEQELYRRMAEDKRRTEKDAEPVGVFLVDPSGALEAWNPAFAALLGLDAAPPAPGTRFPPLFDGAARQVEDCLARCRAGTAPAAATLRLECRDGATRWLQLALHRLAPEGGPDGGPGWCQGLLDDVSRRYHEPSPAGMPELKDAATGVLNRLGAEYGLGQLLDGKARGMAVLALELALAPGTAVDPLLPEAAERITATLRQGTLVARLEAGRFLVVLEPLEDPEAALGVARKLAEALDPPFRIAEGGIARATVAIGLVMRRPGVPELPRILIERAELALVQAHSALLGPRSSINRQ